MPGPTSDFRGYPENVDAHETSGPAGAESTMKNFYPDPVHIDGFDFPDFDNVDFNNGIVTLQQGE